MSLSQCHQCWFLESGWSFETRPGILMRWAQTFHPICQAIAITNLKAVEVFDFRVWIHRRLSQEDQVWGPGLVKQVWGTEAFCRGRRKLAITGEGADYGPILAALLQNTLSLNRLFLSLSLTHKLITGPVISLCNSCNTGWFLTICIREGLIQGWFLVMWATKRLHVCIDVLPRWALIFLEILVDTRHTDFFREPVNTPFPGESPCILTDLHHLWEFWHSALRQAEVLIMIPGQD